MVCSLFLGKLDVPKAKLSGTLERTTGAAYNAASIRPPS